MAYLVFILLTQLVNLTPFTLTFQVVRDGRRLLPELPPGKTRFAKQSRLLRRLREQVEPGWRIRVLRDGEFTGIELDPLVVLGYVRVVFRVENNNVLCVDGIKESSSDYLLRHRYFGCMRNYFWNARTPVSIDRSDTKLATKSRKVEGQCHELASWVDDTSSPDRRYAAAPPDHEKSRGRIVAHVTTESSPCPSPKKIPQQERSKNDHRPPGPPDSSGGLFVCEETTNESGGLFVCEETTNGVKDDFVHGILFILAMTFCFLIKCIH